MTIYVPHNLKSKLTNIQPTIFAHYTLYHDEEEFLGSETATDQFFNPFKF